MATAAVVQPDSNVTGFVSKTGKLLINGKWVEAASGKTFPTYNPATGEVLANVAAGDKEDIDRAVKAARAAFDNGKWSRISPSERGKLLWKLADLLEKHAEEFAQLESLDSRSLALLTCRLQSITSATTPDGPQRSKATPFRWASRSREHSMLTLRANQWASSARSSPGISRC